MVVPFERFNSDAVRR